MADITQMKLDLIEDIKQRVNDKILEESNAALLIKLIRQADDDKEAIAISALGTTYKRTGLHFDKRLDKPSSTIRFFKKNEDLSFVTDPEKPTHKLIIGDNYDALLNLLVQYKGKIDVIYFDPPYGKDSMGEFAKTNYNNAITRDNLLSMLYVRLVVIKQLLSDNSVIFCSIDDRNLAYIKCLFDEIFTEKNFIANVIWQKKTGAADAKGLATITEYVLVYTKNADNVNKIFSTNKEGFDIKRYRYKDIYFADRGPYYLDSLDRGSIRYSDALNYPIKAPDGTTIYPNDRTEFINDGWTWKWSKDKVNWGIENGFIEISKNPKKKCGWSVQYKIYLKVDNEGNSIEKNIPYKNLITDVLNADAANDIKDIFNNKLFSFPKPIALIKRLLKFINSKESIVLDFFAGSGTTGQAVLEMNLDDGGKRTCILCQLNEITPTTPNGIAYDVTSKRMKRIMTGECYDGNKNFEWNKINSPYGENLEVVEIDEVSNFETTKGKTAFDVIDETLYGQKKFQTLKEKVDWVCKNFQLTLTQFESDEEWLTRIKEG